MAKKTAPKADTKELTIGPLTEDKAVAEGIRKADALRADGITKLSELRDEAYALKRNKEILEKTRIQLIEEDKRNIVQAQKVVRKNKRELKKVIKETSKLIGVKWAANWAKSKVVYKATVVSLKSSYEAKLEEIKRAHTQTIASLGAQPETPERKQAIKDEDFAYKSAKSDAGRVYSEGIQKAKDDHNDVYLDKYNALNGLRGNRNSLLESFEYKMREYLYKFNSAQFFMRNALYIVIILIYLFCIVYAPLNDFGNLFTSRNVLTILSQSSTRIFFALGVAGLILLAGTDLSIGRLAGMGMTLTAVILHGGDNVITFFGGAAWNFDSWNPIVRIAFALFLSIFFCTIFSLLAGFFTAKFKMHPFITTLATQLIVYGLMMYSTTGVNSGSLDSAIKSGVAGNWGDFSKLTLYAIIAIAIVWFIWNKTKFGKNMYAVGGNAEAASVSGISVFWVTIGVFILAGILYGIGAFLEATRIGLGSAQSGSGYELDAIAACVVGGISFSGGIGKIKGAVIGVIIFTGLTYCLSFIGFDTNVQFILKGTIIMTACALDSVKYLKKK